MDISQGHVDTSDLMREWIDLGDDKEEVNPYMRFMAYWVAFNMLYAPYKKRVQEYLDRKDHLPYWKREALIRARELLDRDAIELFIMENEHILSNYKPVKTGDAKLFIGRELDILYHNWKSDKVDASRCAIEEGDIVELMHAVYTVRCNFFHGNKKLGDQVDQGFVDSAATIVRGYLGTFDSLPSA